MGVAWVGPSAGVRGPQPPWQGTPRHSLAGSTPDTRPGRQSRLAPRGLSWGLSVLALSPMPWQWHSGDTGGQDMAACPPGVCWRAHQGTRLQRCGGVGGVPCPSGKALLRPLPPPRPHPWSIHPRSLCKRSWIPSCLSGVAHRCSDKNLRLVVQG